MSDRLLDSIDSPHDLKKLSIQQLEHLAAEIRQEILAVVSEHGGHLGASLGAVELTLALHSVFDAPQDLLVWDVGHQAYGHKILTGRRERFRTLRQEGGVAGFPVRQESPYDTFGVAHASTAIGAALGMAMARDLRGESHKVVAIVGDGAMTGGVAFEAINNLGHQGRDVLVVLNDNEMSISKNVGTISKYLTRVTTTGVYNKFEAEVWDLLGHMPLGDKARVLASRVKEGVKNIVAPGMLFEELGLRYFGPFDGHDLPLMIDVLRHVSHLKGPVLVHAVTKKGKGYAFAEAKQETFHGLGSFDPHTGTLKPPQPGPPAWTKVFGQSLVELGRRDSSVIALTAAMPVGTGTQLFADAFPERFVDVGIAEQSAVLLACGLATRGMKPVVAIYSTFLQRAYDQIVHDAALQNLHVVFALDRAGLVGEDGPTHHGLFDIAYFRTVPNVVLMAPSDEEELRHMLFTALRWEGGPIALRFPRGAALGVPLGEDFQEIPIGRGVVLRSGDDVALVGYGTSVEWCSGAAELLAARGIRATVVNARFAKPLDHALLRQVVHDHRHVVLVEEHSLHGGFGSAVLEMLEVHGELRDGIHRLGVPDHFIEQASRGRQLEKLGLTAAGIAQFVLEQIPVSPGVAAVAPDHEISRRV